MKKKEWKARARELEEENRQWLKSFEESVSGAIELREGFDERGKAITERAEIIVGLRRDLAETIQTSKIYLTSKDEIIGELRAALETEKAAVKGRDRLIREIEDSKNAAIADLESCRDKIALDLDNCMKVLAEERQRSNDRQSRLVARQTENDNLKANVAGKVLAAEIDANHIKELQNKLKDAQQEVRSLSERLAIAEQSV